MLRPTHWFFRNIEQHCAYSFLTFPTVSHLREGKNLYWPFYFQFHRRVESPCSSPSELVIRGKGTKRLSGSRVIWYNCSALPWHLSVLALVWTPSSLPSVLFFFFFPPACCWNGSSEGIWLMVIWKGQIKSVVVTRCSVAAPATDMVRTGAKQGNLHDHRGSGGHKGPGIQCRDYPARVAGGVAGGGRSTQQGLWEPEIHGDPGVRQLSASGCLAAWSKWLAWARMYRVSWVLSLAGARLGGPSLSLSILACEKL